VLAIVLVRYQSCALLGTLLLDSNSRDGWWRHNNEDI